MWNIENTGCWQPGLKAFGKAEMFQKEKKREKNDSRNLYLPFDDLQGRITKEFGEKRGLGEEKFSFCPQAIAKIFWLDSYLLLSTCGKNVSIHCNVKPLGQKLSIKRLIKFHFSVLLYHCLLLFSAR